MIPTCMFCGTLDEAAPECPTCGGLVYDMERARDRALIETYQQWLEDANKPRPGLMYIPVVGGALQLVVQFMRGRKLRRELRHRYANRAVVERPHSPYR